MTEGCTWLGSARHTMPVAGSTLWSRKGREGGSFLAVVVGGGGTGYG